MANKPSVPVREVGRKGVPMLRPFEWVARVFQSFRDRPLPSTYKTEVQPVFDVFGTERVEQFIIETSIGALGGLEAVDSKVPGDRYRFYLSAQTFHTDATARHMWFQRVLPDPALGFPGLVFDSGSIFATPQLQQFGTRAITMPPEGRMSSRVGVIAAGARLFLTTLYIEYPIGEPSGDLR